MFRDRGQQTQIGMKRAAFRTQIRREWLDNYFYQKRNQLLKSVKQKYEHEEQLKQKYSQMLKTMPNDNTVDQFINEFEENKMIILGFVSQNLNSIANTMKQMGLKAFMFYAQLLGCTILAYQKSKEEIIDVILRPLIFQGVRLTKQVKYQRHAIIFNLIELLLLLSQNFAKMDQLILVEITEILKMSLQTAEFIKVESDQQDEYVVNYLKTLTIFNNFLSCSKSGQYDEEEQENINQNEDPSLQFQRNLFIQKFFINTKYIGMIIGVSSILCHSKKIIQTTLKVFTNLTYFSVSDKVFFALKDAFIGHFLFTVLTCQGNQLSLILVTRVLHNMLYFFRGIKSIKSVQLFEQFEIGALMRTFHKQKFKKNDFVAECCEMFSNVVYYVEQVQQFNVLEHMFKIGVLDVLIDGCQLISNQRNVLITILWAIEAFIRIKSQKVKDKMRDHSNIFTRLIQEVQNEQIENVCRSILTKIYDEEKNQNFLNQPSKEVQI